VSEAAAGLTCQQLVELITDYLEGSLDERERGRFERHLATCEGCANYLDQMRQTIRITGALTEEQMDPTHRERLLNAFRTWRGR